MGSFRSLEGVVTSGVGGSRSLSWLLAPGIDKPGGAIDVEMDGAEGSSIGVGASSTTAGGGDTTVVAGGAIAVRGATCVSFREANLPACKAGDFFDGTVLLRVSPPVGVDVNAGLPGLGLPFV
jgi:hypothetical protein